MASEEPAPRRLGRMLVPFGRSSTLKSGSLQDLKCTQSAGRLQQQQQQANLSSEPPSSASLSTRARPKLARQRSSQAQPVGRAQRNPFKSSKSMLLLAQNQHIPQASAQLEAGLPLEFVSYAQLASRRAPPLDLELWPTQVPVELQISPEMSHATGGSQFSLKHYHSHLQQQQQQQQQQQANAADSTSSGCNALSSEQCNELEQEERPSCVHIMKKLLCSLLLGALIAVCWVLIVHTLKWVAIRGNEYELLQAPSAGYVTGAAQLLAGQQQAIQVHQTPAPPPPQPQPISIETGDGRRRRRHRLALNELISRRDEINKQNSSHARPLDQGAPVRSNANFANLAHRQDEEHLKSDKKQPAARLSSLSNASTSTLSISTPPDELEPVAEPDLLAELAGQAAGESVGQQAGPATGEHQSTAGPSPGLVYRAPFFTSWFVSTWNILFMPVFTLISSCCFRNEDSTTRKLLVESISQFMDNGLTTFQFLGRCAFFSVLWVGTIFGIVYSLAYIDATVVMALFACSAALVYLLSWVLLHQQFVGVRIVAVIICTTGIALLAYMDNSRTLGSVLIVAGSALCSAVYKVIYQRMFGFWSIAQMSLFFTLIGLFNAFLMWPIALLLYFLGVELIVWRHIPWMHLTAAGALHLTANIVAYFGPICTYDIFLTLGLLFAVVLSAVIDITFYKITFFGMKLAGVLLLMIGFLVCLLPENWNECLYDLANERFIRWKKQRSLKKNRNKVQDMSTGQMSRLRTPSGRVK